MTDTTGPASGPTNGPKDKTLPGWHHVPQVPIQVSPFFSWPPKPTRMVEWIAVRWFQMAENSILTVIALICWAWLQTSLETTKTLSFDWIVAIWLRNMGLMILVAGGLPWVFHGAKRQAKTLKYDPRDLAVDGKNFPFGGQVCDNAFWTLSSGVGVWTAFEVLMFWAMANGYAPVLLWSDNPIWFIAVFFLTPVWISFHFYWIHRALHWGPLYRIAHSLHHRNINVGPWSGLSMHPVEHVLFFSSILIHLIVPGGIVHILFHMQHQALTAATSHTGFENLLVKDKKSLALGTFHHQMHHRYFEVNYGNLEMPWDQWFGTFHDGTRAAHDRLKRRRGRRG